MVRLSNVKDLICPFSRNTFSTFGRRSRESSLSIVCRRTKKKCLRKINYLYVGAGQEWTGGGPETRESLRLRVYVWLVGDEVGGPILFIKCQNARGAKNIDRQRSMSRGLTHQVSSFLSWCDAMERRALPSTLFFLFFPSSFDFSIKNYFLAQKMMWPSLRNFKEPTADVIGKDIWCNKIKNMLGCDGKPPGGLKKPVGFVPKRNQSPSASCFSVCLF